MKVNIAVLCAGACLGALAQGRDEFIQQQAYAEMQRVSGQIDVLQTNFNDLQSRVGRMESGGDLRAIRQEIDALKSSVAELRRDLASQRDEIVKDLSSRIAKLQVQQPEKSTKTTTTQVIGPHCEYIVKSGDTLSLISAAFDVPIRKIKEMNGLKNDNLKIGQKLVLPK